MLWRFYRRLWREAEADRARADARANEAGDRMLTMARLAQGIAQNALRIAEGHPDPIIRGKSRQTLREVATLMTQDQIRAAARLLMSDTEPDGKP